MSTSGCVSRSCPGQLEAAASHLFAPGTSASAAAAPDEFTVRRTAPASSSRRSARPGRDAGVVAAEVAGAGPAASVEAEASSLPGTGAVATGPGLEPAVVPTAGSVVQVFAAEDRSRARRDIEWLFGVGKVRAAALTTTFGAELVGNQKTLPGTKLLGSFAPAVFAAISSRRHQHVTPPPHLHRVRRIVGSAEHPAAQAVHRASEAALPRTLDADLAALRRTADVLAGLRSRKAAFFQSMDSAGGRAGRRAALPPSTCCHTSPVAVTTNESRRRPSQDCSTAGRCDARRRSS